MAKKKLTAEQVKAIDWQALFEKLGPIVAMFVQAILEKLLAKQQAMKCPDGCCCQEIKDLDDADLELLGDYVTSRLGLHSAVEDCPCE